MAGGWGQEGREAAGDGKLAVCLTLSQQLEPWILTLETTSMEACCYVYTCTMYMFLEFYRMCFAI